MSTPAASCNLVKTKESSVFQVASFTQTANLVRLILFLTAYRFRHHHRYATGSLQFHGSLGTDEMVIKQEVASHVYVDSLQGVSPVKYLFPFASFARTWTEDTQGMLSIVSEMVPTIPQARCLGDNRDYF